MASEMASSSALPSPGQAPPPEADGLGVLLLRLTPAVLVAALAAYAYFSGLLGHISLDELKAHRAVMEAFAAAHPVQSVLIYLGLFVTGVTLSLPVALVLILTGGFLFGALWGGVLAVTGSTLGAALIFLICRTALGEVLRRIAGRRLEQMRQGVQRNAFSVLLSLRLMPMAPFWLVNVGAAFFGMSLRSFLAATALGVIPSSFIYAGLGSGIGRMLDMGTDPSLRMVLEPRVLGPLIGLAVLALAPLAWRLARRARAA